MLRNYFNTAIRNILKNKIFSVINVLGLSIGMAACLLILHYINYEKSYEHFHQRSDQLYRVTVDSYNGSELVVQDAETHPVLGPELKEKFPEVLDFVRMHDDELVKIKVGDKLYKETRLYFADPSAFDLFSIEILEGDPKAAFHIPFKIALSSNLAALYFGSTDIVGKTIQLPNEGELVDVEIVGVYESLPSNTHLKFNALVSFSTLKKSGYDPGWNGNNEFTYLLMQKGTDLQAFNDKLVKYSAALNDKIENSIFVAEPMNDIHLYSNKTYEPETNGDAKTIYFLLVVAFFIIVIAWVNYLNLSTARSAERAKEVGVRKVVGSSRLNLIWQFLLESAVINIAAMVLTLIVVQISLPYFIELSGQPLPRFIFTGFSIWVIIALLIVGTILSGLYPALALSAFQPVAVIKGKLKSSNHGFWLRRGLVVFQFIITVILIAGTFAVFQQLNFLRSRDLGMKIDEILVVEAPLTIDNDSINQQRMSVLKSQWRQRSEVQNISNSGSVPGLAHKYLNSTTGVSITGVNSDQNHHTFYHFGIDASFIETLGLGLVEGRNFTDKEKNSDQLILNEEAARLLGFENAADAVGKKINFGKTETVIGVIKNYHHHYLKLSVAPIIYWYKPNGYFTCLDIKTNDIHATLNAVKTDFEKVFPNSTFTYFFLDEKFNQQYAADVRFGKVFGLFATLAIVIACLGLFGLSSFTALQRTKEIGIRKVLGASVPGILVLLSRDYMKLLLIAVVVAVPLANYLIIEWLNNFAVKINVQWWLLALPCVLVGVVAILSVSSQSIRAATINPVDSLKHE